MNFLELINKCLLELNYKQVNTISELVKNDHKRIMSILNVINKEICNVEPWKFLIRKTTLVLPKGKTEIDNPVSGRIWYLIISGKKYKYSPDVESFLTEKNKDHVYSAYNDKLLLPKFDEDKTIEVVYYTSNCVKTLDGEEMNDFKNATDCSLIPMPFVEQLLVYGTCLRLKANPQYIKFTYWLSMYKEALLNLKSKSNIYIFDSPVIRLYRR